MLTDQWFVAMSKPAPDGTFNRGQGDRGASTHRGGEIKFVPGELDQHLQPVAEEHPGLVHLAPALVGPPDPGVVRRGRQDLRRRRPKTKRARKAAAAGYTGTLKRDDDVLDTWFSSALVPFSSLGWPDEDAGAASCSCRRRCSSPASTSSSSGSPG